MSRRNYPYAWERLRRIVIAEESVCWLCGHEVDKSLRFPHRLSASADHVVPLARGGQMLDRLNVRLAHYGCNSRRQAGRRKPRRNSRKW